MICLGRRDPPFPASVGGWFRKLAVGNPRSREGALLNNREEDLDFPCLCPRR